MKDQTDKWNRDQTLHYLLYNGVTNAEQRMEWSNSRYFSEETAQFLAVMPFSADTCDRCGEPVYEGDKNTWLRSNRRTPHAGPRPQHIHRG